MNAMQASAQAFADLHDDEEPDTDANGDAGDGAAVTRNQSRDEFKSLPTCIVCRIHRPLTEESSDSRLGLLCWAQRSSVYCPSEANTLHAARLDEDIQSLRSDNLVPVLTCCGHAMHRDCFDQFWSGELAKNQSIFLNGKNVDFILLL